MSTIASIKHFILRHKIIAIIVAVVVVGFLARGVFTQDTDTENMFISVRRGDLVQEVSVTGRLKPASAVDLAFERGGKVGSVRAKVGDKLVPGQIVVSLASDDLYAQYRQAQAGVNIALAQLNQQLAALKSQELKLAQLKQGTRPEEITLAKTAVQNAEQVLTDAEANYAAVKAKADTDLANLYDDVPDVLNDAYKNADDAIRSKLAGFFTFDSSRRYALAFNSCDPQAQIDVPNMRPIIEEELVQWQKELLVLTSPPEGYDYDKEVKTTRAHMEKIKQFLERINALLITGCSLNDPNRATDRTNLSAARASINTSSVALNTQIQAVSTQKATNFSALSTAQAKINDANNALKTAQDQLSLKEAGSTSQDIEIQEATVEQARANVDAQRGQVESAQANADSAGAQVEKTIIRSPIEGILTKQETKVGEIVAANAELVSVMSFAQFEIEANVPEVDIGSVKVGNSVKITIDAFPGDTFTGKVIEVDPAEQVVDGVVNFRVKVIFDNAEERFKSGLTSNLEIETDKREGVLILPQYAIAETDEGTFVRVMEGGDQKDIPIVVGIRSKEGDVEIISGVEEGQEVLNIGFKSL